MTTDLAIYRDDDMHNIKALCAFDTKQFALHFMPGTFNKAITHQHEDAFLLLDDDRYAKTAMCCWRSFGKTTMGLATILRRIIYKQVRYVMIVAHNLDKAIELSEMIKQELILNERIVATFGLYKQVKTDETTIEFQFAKKGWYACDPTSGEPICFIRPYGANQQFRGALIRIGDAWVRPELMYIDDAEDDTEVNNAEIRRAVRDNMEGALNMCVGDDRPDPETRMWQLDLTDPTAKPPWRIIYADTLKHEDAYMAHILTDPDFTKVRFAQSRWDSETQKYYSLVPERITDEQVQAEAMHFERIGKADVYAREKMCRAINPAKAQYKDDFFKYYDKTKLNLNTMKNITKAIIVDPGRTSNDSSCNTGMIAFAASMRESKWWIRAEYERVTPIEFLPGAVLDFALEYNSRIIAVETMGGDDWIVRAFVEEVGKRGITGVQFIWIKKYNMTTGGDYGRGQVAGKIARAHGLLKWYKGGHIIHELGLKDGALEEQEKSFPRPPRWDVLDCAGHIPKVLDELGCYFEPIETEVMDSFNDPDFLEDQQERDENYDHIGDMPEGVDAYDFMLEEAMY
jgi:hypothetical protein